MLDSRLYRRALWLSSKGSLPLRIIISLLARRRFIDGNSLIDYTTSTLLKIELKWAFRTEAFVAPTQSSLCFPGNFVRFGTQLQLMSFRYLHFIPGGSKFEKKWWNFRIFVEQKVFRILTLESCDNMDTVVRRRDNSSGNRARTSRPRSLLISFEKLFSRGKKWSKSHHNMTEDYVEQI